MKDLKYRFDEIVTTVRLLPDSPTDEDKVVFPNLTRDLHEPELYSAILCQSMKEGDNEDFQIKMITALANSAMESVMSTEHDVPPSEDDMYAVAVAANIAWACGSVDILFKMTGLLAALTTHFDVEIPDLATAFLKGNKGADRFGTLDPYKILSHEYSPAEIIEHALDGNSTSSELDEILKLLRQRGEK